MKTTKTSKTQYVAETIGSNACSNTFTHNGRRYRSHNTMTFDPCVVLDDETGLVAVFETIAEARKVAQGIRWANQTIRVRRLRKADWDEGA